MMNRSKLVSPPSSKYASGKLAQVVGLINMFFVNRFNYMLKLFGTCFQLCAELCIEKEKNKSSLLWFVD